MGTRSLKGRLLVATPTLSDPNFTRTVVLLLEHDDEGAVGVVLNRPSDTDVGEPLPDWAPLAAHPQVVFVGGPVSPSAAVCLARVGPPGDAEGWQPVVEQVGTVDLNREPTQVRPAIAEVRVFAGYAGWGPGQLESEIDAGGWYVVDATPGDALSPAPGGLWRAVLRRQPGDLAMVANFPANPSLN